MASASRRNAGFQPELRKNIVTREWVIIAKGRGKRPSDLRQDGDSQDRPPQFDSKCPFCPGNEGKTPPEVFALRDGGPRNSRGWSVRVVPNKFAALRADGSDALRSVGIYSARDGFGAHEVVIESPDHDKDLWEMDTQHVEGVVEAYRQRYLAYEVAESLRHVLIFRNHGPKAGTTLIHPHTQLIAGPVLPHQVQLELLGAGHYWEYLGKCVFCEIVDYELSSGERAVFESDHFVVITAFAGRYPFETWVIPKRHSIRFADMSEEEASDFASVLKEVLRRIALCLGRPSYNYAIHSAPSAEYNVRAYHWHLEIYPRITTLGGFELGSDIYINVISPEDAAKSLREVGQE